jgi:hypothetical protein
MKKINDILKNRTGIKNTAKIAAGCDKAEKIINNYIKQGSIKVVKHQNNTLFIKAKPIISQKIYQDQEKIIEKIENDTELKIRRISFRN